MYTFTTSSIVNNIFKYTAISWYKLMYNYHTSKYLRFPPHAYSKYQATTLLYRLLLFCLDVKIIKIIKSIQICIQRDGYNGFTYIYDIIIIYINM